MNTLRNTFDSPLEPLGAAVGAFLVLAALGTLIGAPWATAQTMLVAIIQIVGALLMGGIGAGILYVSFVVDG
ncbi:hypothetical protein [Haloarcula montana]|uniref:hypothetical protein n=1 Tax=Haloarcula montana TaxID=3111776 RepID=UPI002D793A77|nr:hypothetical protein [Haloarcula sp. GH36]